MRARAFLSSLRRPAVSAGLLALAWLALPVSVMAGAAPWEGEPFRADPRELVRAAAEAAAKETDSVLVLLDERRLEVDASGRLCQTTHLVYRINNESALEWWSGVDEQWAPWRQDRPQVRARVVTPDGVVHELDPKLLVEATVSEDDPVLYGDRRVLRAPLPAVGVGAVVEEMRTVCGTQPDPAGGFSWRTPLGRFGPVRMQRIVLTIPSGMPFHVALQGVSDVVPEKREVGDRIEHTYVFRDPTKWERFEGGLPPDVPPTPSLGISTVPSWQAVAAAYAAIVNRQLTGADLGGTAKKWAGGARGREQVIEAVANALRKEIRYTGVHFGDASIVPWVPREALKRGFGDCKDQATLLVGLLRALGIEAHVALLRTGPGLDLDARLPGLEVFDHAIVYIPGSPATWVDPTARLMRAGALPEQDLGRQALVATPATTELLLTPTGSAADNRAVFVREVLLAKKGEGRVVETVEAWGIPEAENRAMFAGMKPDTRDERLRSYVRDEFMAKELGPVTIGDTSDLSRPFRYSLEARKCSRASTVDTAAAVTMPVGVLLQAIPAELWKEEVEEGETPKVRRSDFMFAYPFTRELRYRVAPPPGFAPRPLPPREVRSLGTLTLAQEVSADPAGVVTVSFRLDSGKSRLTPAEVESVRSDLGKLAEENALQIWFDQVGEAHLAAGRVREALEEFGTLARQFPKEAMHHDQMARALLAAGMGEEARAEALLATQVEPASAAAHATRGWILQHDLIGRRFKPGFDRTGALAAYRTARDLDPKDAGIRADLAILLEHAADGERYQSGPDLTEAITEYRYIRNELKDKRFDTNLRFALLWAQRFGELYELASELKPDAESRAWQVTARSALDGAVAGIADAQRRIPDGAERRQALGTTAERLLRLRLYEDAAALLDEVAKGAAEAVQLRARAEVLRKVRRYDEMDLGSSDALGLLKRLLVAVYETDPGGGKVLALYSPDVVSLLRGNKELMDAFLEDVRDAGASPAALGLPKLVLTDLTLTLVEGVVDGADKPVQRVRAQISAGDRPVRLELYMAERPDGLKMLASATEIGFVGVEVLRRVEAGDLETARQLCEWARESIRPLTGDDPLAGPLFPRVWSKGDGADPHRLRLAGAVLAGGSPLAGTVLSALEAECAAPVGEGLKVACELALAQAYAETNQYERMLPVAQRLLAAYPDSDAALAMVEAASGGLGKWDLAVATARARLQRSPGDRAGRRLLGDALGGVGDYAGAQRELQALVDDGKEAVSDYNQLAWYALMAGKVDDTALLHAQRAVERSGGQASGVIHTQAALFAERGQTTEAYQAILKGIAASGDDQPSDSDWYVFGRLAEWYGLPDAAARYYRRVELAPFEPRATSTYLLAQRRLEVLGKTGAAKKATAR